MTTRRNLGCRPSVLTGDEMVFGTPKSSLSLPESYTYVGQMPPVLDQGNTNTCVTYALDTYLNWNINMSAKTRGRDNHVDRKSIYSVRTVPGDNGMTIKEGLSYIRNHGVKTDVGLVKIGSYARVMSIVQLKYALVLNGPLVAGLMCHETYSDEFWKDGTEMGGHAVSIVGYDTDGMIIRNSWGTSYGHDGYICMDYGDFNRFFEIWTIID